MNLIGAKSQTLKSTELCDMPPPKATDIKMLCDCIAIKEKPTGKDKEHFDYGFEKRLLTLSGADIEKDGFDLAFKKLQCYWAKKIETIDGLDCSCKIPVK